MNPLSRVLVAVLLTVLPVLAFAADPVPRAVVSLTLMTDEFVADLLPPERIRAYSRSVDDATLSNAVEAAKNVKGRAWLDLETLLRLQPDLIVAADWSEAGDLDYLRQKGYRVFVVKTPRTWSQVKDRVRELGGVLGRPEAADALLKKLAAREAALKANVQGARPTVLEYNSFGSSMGAGTLWNDMVALAGLTNASAALTADEYGYAPLSKELLLKLDPDWLVLPSPAALALYGQPTFLADLQADPLYKNLKAVRAGHVIYVSEALKTTTSHAVLGAAEVLQRAAYPNLR